MVEATGCGCQSERGDEIAEGVSDNLEHWVKNSMIQGERSENLKDREMRERRLWNRGREEVEC